MIKNLVDAEKQRNKNTSTLVTQLIEILNICMFQLLKILHNQKKYLKKELKTIVEEIIAKENQQNSYRMFFWSEYVKITMLCTMAVRCQQDLSCFWIGPTLFCLSPSHLLSPSFPFYFPVPFLYFFAQRSDLVAMCTVEKINDGCVCRKRLWNAWRGKLKALPKKLINKTLRDKKKERKTK